MLLPRADTCRRIVQYVSSIAVCAPEACIQGSIVCRDDNRTTGPHSRPRSSHVTRIRPDQQVIQSTQQIADEWCHVGPFLAVQGTVAAQTCANSTEPREGSPCVTEQETFAEAHQKHEGVSDVAARVIGAEQYSNSHEVCTVSGYVIRACHVNNLHKLQRAHTQSSKRCETSGAGADAVACSPGRA